MHECEEFTQRNRTPSAVNGTVVSLVVAHRRRLRLTLY